MNEVTTRLDSDELRLLDKMADFYQVPNTMVLRFAFHSFIDVYLEDQEVRTMLKKKP